MTEQDPGSLADRLEGQADQMEDRSEHVKGQIDEARQDWQQKRASDGVPGAKPPEGDDAERDDGESGEPGTEKAD